MHFSYDKSQREALVEIREFLEKEGFQILEYAPEDGFMFTDYKSFVWDQDKFFQRDQGERLIALTVHIHDKVTITGMGKMDILVTGIGNKEELQKIIAMDTLPYKIQKKIFFPIGDKMRIMGYHRLNE